jgi:thioesterase domain-containing protein
VTRLRPGQGGSPFYFLHGDYINGGVYCARVAEGLGTDRAFFLVQPFARDGSAGVPPIEDMAAERVAALRALQPHGPYVLGGYCINGAVAFEMARRLEADGEDVRLLVLIDVPRGLRERPLLRSAIGVAARLLRWPKARATAAYVRWHRRVAYFQWLGKTERIAWIKRAAGQPAGRNDDILGELAQGYSESIERYRPGPYQGRVLMINSRSSSSPKRRALTDWSGVARRSTVHLLDADHESIVRDHGEALGALIRRAAATVDGVVPTETATAKKER